MAAWHAALVCMDRSIPIAFQRLQGHTNPKATQVGFEPQIIFFIPDAVLNIHDTVYGTPLMTGFELASRHHARSVV